MKRMRSGCIIPAMEEQEWRTELKRLGITPQEAATLLYYKTGVVLDLADTYRQFGRFSRLSKTSTAMWRLLFKVARRRKTREAA